MPELVSTREAKDFLAGRIAAEAMREGHPLTEVERKMLYFSRTGWTLPDMEAVSAEFKRSYDQASYEQKIVGLVRNLYAFEEGRSKWDRHEWDRALQTLRNGDHYIYALIRGAGSSRGAFGGPGGGRLRNWLIALGIVIGLALLWAFLQAM